MSTITAMDCSHNLKRHVRILAENIGERHLRKQAALQKAANYISHCWEAMGYAVERQEFEVDGVTCENLFASKLGDKNSDEYLLICAHYDSAANSPGANDASGMAALLEIARAFSLTEVKRNVRFVALCNEKTPYLGTQNSGSWVYAHRASQQFDKIRTAIVLDSLGYYNNARGSQLHPPLLGLLYPSQGNFIAMTANTASLGVMRSFARAFKNNAQFKCRAMIAPNLLPWVQWHDNSPFWLHGYKAFSVTDTAPYRYPFHNSSRDTQEKLDYQCLNTVTIGLTRALHEYAGGK